MFKELDLFLFLSLFESKFSLRICIKYSVIYYKQYLNPIQNPLGDLISLTPRACDGRGSVGVIFKLLFTLILTPPPSHAFFDHVPLPRTTILVSAERFLYTGYAKNGTQYN
tara:strand:- start:2935 stop:3267 length:333 start_codon:yes stop_codon:yes gene_type:complete